jgi:cysteinyl-tRNA synthetase
MYVHCASADPDAEGQREEVLMPYLRVMSSFRDAVRSAAIAKDEGALKTILALCDKLRDTDLVPLGVALDDLESACAPHFTEPVG